LNPSILAVSVFFHLVATAFWIGGLLVTVITVWPEARRALGEDAALLAFMSRLRRRITPYFNLSLAVLLATGMVQMSLDSNYDGLLQFDNDWSRVILFKHILLIGMVLCSLTLQWGVAPALERHTLLLARGKGDPADYARQRHREIWLTRIMLALGVLILACSAWATVL
jgi:uncharacterized membrane protein